MIFNYNPTNNYNSLVLIPRISLGLFIILQILGMSFYPGGTIHDGSTIGYSVAKNFFSDMGAYAARNGEPNYLSMIIFSFSLTIVGLTFCLYYSRLPAFLGNDRINYIFCFIGSIFAFFGSICMIGTGLTPTDIVFDLHVFFANNIFHCFLVTSFFYTIVIFRSNIMAKKYAFGYGGFFISIFFYVGVLQYGPPANENSSSLIFQVVSQKLIVLIFCASTLHQTFCFEKYDYFNNNESSRRKK